jgi:hypothetical protein
VNPKGLSCPSCRGVRLHTYVTRRVCPGLVVRYRQCVACGTGLRTEERVATVFRAATPPPDPAAGSDERRAA